jgi:triphosphatase
MSGSVSPIPEVEWQFDAVDLRPVGRWLRSGNPEVAIDSAGRAREQVDVYADTDDWRLHRGGFSLRLRRRSGKVEATLKNLTSETEALKQRTELTEEVPTADLEVIGRLGGPVGRIVRGMAGSHPLRRVVEIRTRRSTFHLSLDGVRVGEIALDSTTIPIDGDDPARLRRVEVEVAPEVVPRLRPFVDGLREACALTPAAMSKFEVGLLAAGHAPAAFLEFGPTEIGAGSSTGEVAFAALRQQFTVFLLKEPRTRLREDPEELHDMRVSIRRMRAALALFADAMPVRAARFRNEFSWVADVLGRVRDLDVQLEDLDGWERDLPAADRSSLRAVRRLLEDERSSAESAMISALDSARYERLVAGFAAFLRRGPLRRSTASRTPILVTGPSIVARRYRRVRKAARGLTAGSSPEAFHRLRIRAKRLRYALEFTEPVYGKRARTLIKRLAALQDLLGEHQDAQVAMRRLGSLVDELGSELEPKAMFAMGRIAERYALRAMELRGGLDDAFKPLRRRWRRLRHHMDARREELARRPPELEAQGRPSAAAAWRAEKEP